MIKENKLTDILVIITVCAGGHEISRVSHLSADEYKTLKPYLEILSETPERYGFGDYVGNYADEWFVNRCKEKGLPPVYLPDDEHPYYNERDAASDFFIEYCPMIFWDSISKVEVFLSKKIEE